MLSWDFGTRTWTFINDDEANIDKIHPSLFVMQLHAFRSALISAQLICITITGTMLLYNNNFCYCVLQSVLRRNGKKG